MTAWTPFPTQPTRLAMVQISARSSIMPRPCRYSVASVPMCSRRTSLDIPVSLHFSTSQPFDCSDCGVSHFLRCHFLKAFVPLRSPVDQLAKPIRGNPWTDAQTMAHAIIAVIHVVFFLRNGVQCVAFALIPCIHETVT
jgi:hypothetical protein